MSARILLLVFILFTACQTGKIPCPKIKTAKIRKSNPNKKFALSSATLTADVKNYNDDEKPRQAMHNKGSKSSDVKMIQHVSVEEWDCPRPGSKKYMPKTVKENIRNNMKRINAGVKSDNDSLKINPTPVH